MSPQLPYGSNRAAHSVQTSQVCGSARSSGHPGRLPVYNLLKQHYVLDGGVKSVCTHLMVYVVCVQCTERGARLDATLSRTWFRSTITVDGSRLMDRACATCLPLIGKSPKAQTAHSALRVGKGPAARRAVYDA